MSEFWSGKKVLITGHTGFKGAWLTLLLNRRGAKLYGYALPAETQSLYRALNLSRFLDNEKLADIADRKTLEDFYHATSPDITIHMAAQALVLPSYADPLETFRVNILGTTTLLDIICKSQRPQTVISVTSDKVYENNETGQSYVETDSLGGKDPYSASKACAELVTASFRKSFCADPADGVKIKSARAGNVIGAGDWSPHRLIPDAIKAIHARQVLILRHPAAVRPWQHVLEPLSGYLLLAEKTVMAPQTVTEDSFNFGPDRSSCLPTGEIIERLSVLYPGLFWRPAANTEPQPQEAKLLHLDSTRARTRLGWKPRWGIDQTLTMTAAGYQALHDLPAEQACQTLVGQIDTYFQKS
jgi:CDP-glucose 4,6-dehydratase